MIDLIGPAARVACALDNRFNIPLRSADYAMDRVERLEKKLSETTNELWELTANGYLSAGWTEKSLCEVRLFPFRIQNDNGQGSFTFFLCVSR